MLLQIDNPCWGGEIWSSVNLYLMLISHVHAEAAAMREGLFTHSLRVLCTSGRFKSIH